MYSVGNTYVFFIHYSLMPDYKHNEMWDKPLKKDSK